MTKTLYLGIQGGMKMKVKMIWYELVKREDILEVGSLDEAYDTEIVFGNGEEVSTSLHWSDQIQHIVIDEENEDDS